MSKQTDFLNMLSVSTNHIVEAGTEHIASLTFRKELFIRIIIPRAFVIIQKKFGLLLANSYLCTLEKK